MPARIRRGDEVIVISGKDNGKAGKVLRLRNCGSELARDDQLTSAEFLLTFPQFAVTNPLAGDSLN